MEIITEPRLGQIYKIIPTSHCVRYSTANRFLPPEGITAVYDEFYHSRFQEGAIQLFKEEEKQMETIKLKGGK